MSSISKLLARPRGSTAWDENYVYEVFKFCKKYGLESYHDIKDLILGYGYYNMYFKSNTESYVKYDLLDFLATINSKDEVKKLVACCKEFSNISNIFRYELQKRYRGIALKTDPYIEEGDRISIENMKKAGFEYLITKDGYDTVQCRSNYVLDLEGRSCEEIYSAFHKKHRYNIRVAERKGVECGFFGTDKLQDFYMLMQETGARDGFQIRSKEYFERILTEMGSMAKLCMCYYEEKPVSGALIVNYGGTMSYLYGASSNSHREVMANYLMHWTIIKRCKELGCRIYDFMGIPYYYDKNHQNYGVYRFKKGFGGRIVNYAGEFRKVYYPVVGRLLLKVMNWLGYKL